jgi:hypothetical protein
MPRSCSSNSITCPLIRVNIPQRLECGMDYNMTFKSKKFRFTKFVIEFGVAQQGKGLLTPSGVV